ncbi:MAG: hypothetical protein HZY79_09345 [Rhodoblastus sp.]|nr:MAG: hypothetical protein HZY79_09345 [Rhodoblastus sp.]
MARPARPIAPPRRPTVERDGSAFGFDIEAALTHLATAALVLGFAVYAWRTGMSVETLAKRCGGAALAYVASRRLTTLFGDWKAWRLRGAATLWLPFEWQFAVSIVSFALARQPPEMARKGLDLENRLFGLPTQLVLAAALYAAFAFGQPYLPKSCARC